MFNHLIFYVQSFLGKAKPKINPIDNSIQVNRMKNQAKARSKLSINTVRNSQKSLPHHQLVKQEIDEDFGEIRHLSTSMDGSTNVSAAAANSNKNQIIITKRTSLDSSQLQNGSQTLQQTAAGKLIVNNTSITSLGNNSNAKKLYTINSQNSNILLLSSPNSGSSNSNKLNDGTIGTSSGPIKLMTTVGSNKKPVFTEIKDAKSLEKFQFFNSSNKSGSQPVIKRFVINNPNQTNSTVIQEKDAEIAKLKDENGKLKKELEEIRSLIISKDLEIERLKKLKTSNNNNNHSIGEKEESINHHQPTPPSNSPPPTLDLDDDEQLD